MASQKNEDKARQGFGFEDETSKGKKEDKQPAKKKDASNITFGGARPTFGRNKKHTGLGKEFDQGLDDIDESGNTKAKKDKKPADSQPSD